jgi:hypothetical protein
MKSRFSLKFTVLFIFLLVALSSAAAFADEKIELTEKSASSEGDTTDFLRMTMNDFHDVMAPLWHQAFPEGDFKSIREKAPLLKDKLMVMLKVQLPSYLEQDEEKLETFLGKRQELTFHVSEVVQAASDSADSILASAFERMHWVYEELEKVFAVPIKELDSFHETLYFLWHKALPNGDYDAIKQTAPVMKAEVDSLMNVPLPYGCAKKKDEFEKRKTALKDAVYQLAQACENGGDEKKIQEAVGLVHDKFMDINRFLR